MKVSNIKIKNYKRFTDLEIIEIPESAKIVFLVGSNGSGKSSLFDAFYFYYSLNAGNGWTNDKLYHLKFNDPNPIWFEFVKIYFHKNPNLQGEQFRDKFYFRTAYRNQPDFTVSQLQHQANPLETRRFENFIQNDITVSENYQRLISKTLSGIYENTNNKKTVEEFREELIGKIRESVTNVFDDLVLSSIGDPLSNGSFYFHKGIVDNFHYKNLSGGEKSVFDILLDINIKSTYYPEAIYCIDEPEAHMHTSLQAKLLEEINRIIPSDSQLWLATHSIGMLKKAKEIELTNPGSIVFINLDEANFDYKVILRPTRVDKTIWDKFFELSLGEFSSVIAPNKIVFCEGTNKGRKYKNFDALIYSRIFQNNYPDVSFVSIGSSNELQNTDNPVISIIKQILNKSEVIIITDRDDKSDGEISELKLRSIKVLNKRHLESYLLDDEIILLLCNKYNSSEKYEEAIRLKKEKIEESIKRGNQIDDIKSASGDIFVALKKLLGITHGGDTKDAFMRDTMCPLITPDTEVYKTLEKEIFC